MSERIAQAAQAWAKTWSAWDLAGDVGEGLTCSEADAVIGLLRALGEDQAADNWLAMHAAGDDGGDAHYRYQERRDGE